MDKKKQRVAVIGCGYLGQKYIDAYQTYPDTEVVAIAEHSPDRRQAVGKRYGVAALYPDVEALLKKVVPDIVAVVTPTKYYKEIVLACVEMGVKAVSTDKPIGAVLSDVDEMIEACEAQGVLLAGGYLQRAMNEVQETARRIRAGEFGEIIGSRVAGWGTEISGGGCQHISVLRLFTDAEVDEVMAWSMPAAGLSPHLLPTNGDAGLVVNGIFRLSNGLDCPVFGKEFPTEGVDVWSEDAMIRWRFGKPEIFKGYDVNGARKQIDPHFEPYKWSEFGHLTGSIRSFLAAIENGSEPWVTCRDLRAALEVAIASKLSADLGSARVKLPLKDRSLSLYPADYRWMGGDPTGLSRSEL